MATNRVIRRLRGAKDVPLFREIRFEGLRTNPEAFASTAQDWERLSDAEWLARLDTPVFAALAGDRPIGLMGYLPERASKMSHRASLVMVFITPALRRTGVAADLLSHACDAARADGIDQMELAVAVDNAAAIRFYRRAGFETVGTIPRGFRHEGGDIDELLMVRRLDA